MCFTKKDTKQHPIYPWIVAQIDGYDCADFTGNIVEVKSTRSLDMFLRDVEPTGRTRAMYYQLQTTLEVFDRRWITLVRFYHSKTRFVCGTRRVSEMTNRRGDTIYYIRKEEHIERDSILKQDQKKLYTNYLIKMFNAMYKLRAGVSGREIITNVVSEIVIAH